MNVPMFPSNAVFSAIVALVGAEKAKRVTDASRAAVGADFARVDRSKADDTTSAKVAIAPSNKTRGETAKVRLTETRVSTQPSNRPLRLWYLAQQVDTLARLSLAPESLTLPVDLELWIKTTPSFNEATDAPATNGNGKSAKNGKRSVTPAVAA